MVLGLSNICELTGCGLLEARAGWQSTFQPTHLRDRNIDHRDHNRLLNVALIPIEGPLPREELRQECVRLCLPLPGVVMSPRVKS